MGGHGGLNILPQKSWHVYNQDNREKVARDEAKHEAEQAEKRATHQRAESQFRHATLLARARREPVVAAGLLCPPVQAAMTLAGQQPLAAHEKEPQQMEAAVLAAEPHPAAVEEPPAPDAAAPGEQHAKHDIMAKKRAIQQDDGHFNFWKAEELRAGNAEVKADEVQERRKRGDPATQTSDPRFDERFKLGHAMHGKGHMPWYSVPGAFALPRDDTPGARALDGGQLLASAAAAPSADAALEQPSKKRKHKDKKKRRHLEKDGKMKVSAKQLKASVAQMRSEREAREAAERVREKQLLRQTFRT